MKRVADESPSRFHLEHRRTIQTRDGVELFLVARPRSLARDPLTWPIPGFLIVAWIACRQAAFKVRRRPAWQLDVCEYPVLEDATVIAVGSKTEMIQRLAAEATARSG